MIRTSDKSLAVNATELLFTRGTFSNQNIKVYGFFNRLPVKRSEKEVLNKLQRPRSLVATQADPACAKTRLLPLTIRILFFVALFTHRILFVFDDPSCCSNETYILNLVTFKNKISFLRKFEKN